MSRPRKKSDRTYIDPELSGGKLPPQAIEFEEAVLGAILMESTIIHTIINNLVPELFFLDQHQMICEAITQLYKDKRPIDTLTVSQKLKDTEKLDLVGGSFYLAKLTAQVSSSANIEYQIMILQQMALKRKLIMLAFQAVQDGYSESGDIFASLHKLQLALDTSVKDVIKYEISTVNTIHQRLYKESIFIAQHGLKSGVPSGLRMLDNVTNGWQKSDLILIAGRPSMGKTAIAVTFILNPAINEHKAIGVFSLEMSKDQLVGRMQSQLSGYPVDRVINKKLTEPEIDDMAIKCAPLETAKIFIDDTPSLRIMEFKSKARKMVVEQGVELIVVDYLQLMRSDDKKQSREQEVAEISRELKGTAKELNIPIIALAQLSRAVETRGGDKKPNMSDLRESGQLEQDADMLGFCYRPEYYKFENYEVDGEEFESYGLFMLLIEKHRNGALGEIPMKFIHKQAKIVNHPRFEVNEEFQNYEDITYQDVPDRPVAAGSDKNIFNIGARLLEESGEKPLPTKIDEIPF